MKLVKDLKKSAKKYVGKTGELKEKAQATSESLKEPLGYMKKEAGEQVGSLKKEARRLKKVLQSKDAILVKTDAIAILLRKMGKEDEFLAAFDKLTKEGYRMVIREEVRELPISSGFNIQLGTYYYFQNVKYITQ